jgi:DNA helicase-2/ATP-dependent DNA helicase PcrA
MTKTRTAAQTAAIESDANEIVLLAGPGSGKTTTLIARILHRVTFGTAPKKIACITFTNAAADEMAARLPSDVVLGYVGTLHGFALRYLQRFGRQVGYGERVSLIGEDEGRDLMESIARELKVNQSLDRLWEMKKQGRPTQPRLSRDHLVVAEYFDRLKRESAADFDVLLTEFRDLLMSGAGRALGDDFAELYVDEFQDSGTVDFQIYELLPVARKFYVGDPDQSIYGFRGADVNGILKKARGAGVTAIKLEENFRSLPAICEAAQRLIENNPIRAAKRTISASSDQWADDAVTSLPACDNEREEIGRVIGILRDERADMDSERMRPDWHDIAILTRTNALAYSFRDAIRAAGIPVHEPKKRTDPMAFSMLITTLNFLIDPENNLAAEQYVRARMGKEIAADQRRQAAARQCSINALAMRYPQNIPALDAPKWLREIGMDGEAVMFVSEKLRAMHATADTTMADLALRVMMREDADDDDSGGVHVMTVHAAKGREWDVVILPAFEEEVTPSTRMGANIPEERRLAYVAATRARHRLYITTARERVAKWGGSRVHRPSRFLRELLGNNS